jgi:hypothetical protein
MEQQHIPSREGSGISGNEGDTCSYERTPDGKNVVFTNYYKDGGVRNRISVPIGSLDVPRLNDSETEPEPKSETNRRKFDTRISDNQDLKEQYRQQFGPEAYRYRMLYEEAARQLNNLYDFAKENGIELPNPGPSFT